MLEVLTNVDSKTEQFLSNYDIDSLRTDALNISLDLSFERSNVSRLLNTLHKSGKLIKILGRPTLFLSRITIEQFAPSIYIPSSIPIGININDYLSKEIEAVHSVKDVFSTDLVSDDSLLFHANRKSKSAVLYPNNNLNILLFGEPYVGKLELATNMIQYSRGKQQMSQTKEIVSIDCKHYLPDNQENLLIRLFGSLENSTDGLIKENPNSFIIIMNLNLLDQSIFQIIDNTLTSRSFSPFDAPNSHPKTAITTRIIGIVDNPMIKDNPRFKRLFPIQVEVPRLEKRTVEELLFLILEAFQIESTEINKTIRISTGVLSCFVMAQYESNIIHLFSEIKSACASAFLNSIDTESFFIDIHFEDISNEVLESISNINARLDDLNEILNLFESESLFFSPNQKNIELQLLTDITKTIDFVEIDSINRLDNQIVDVCLEEINYVTSIQLNTIRAILLKDIYNEIYPLLKTSSFIENENLLYGLLLHLSTTIKKIKSHNYSIKEQKKDFKIANASDYKLANIIKDTIEDVYSVTLPDYEIEYIATYHYLSSQWIENSYIQLLIISENDENSKNYSTYLNSLNTKSKSFFLDTTPSGTKEEIQNIIIDKMGSIDKGKGVIIASDSDSVIYALDGLEKLTPIDFTLSQNVSVQYLVSLMQKINSLNVSLNTIRNDSSDFEPELKSPTMAHSRDILDQISNKLLSESLIFLNPSKAVNLLYEVLLKIESELNIKPSDELLIKFIFHCSFLIERCIRKEPINDPEARNIISSNPQIFFIIESNFSIINETFSINIPNSELGMVINIFKQNIEENSKGETV